MKKILSIFLVITSLLYPNLAFAEGEEATAPVYSDKETEAFGVLNVLGIYTNDDAETNNPVTRGEFTELALKFAGMSSIEIAQSSEPLRFPDAVNSDYRAAISLAAARGYVKGYGDGYFYPDSYITADEISTIINNILGYNSDDDYSIATDDFMTGINVNADGSVAKRYVARVLFNALEQKVIELDFSNGHNYAMDNTALYSFFGVQSVTGAVNANNVTALTETAGCNDNQVVIGTETYLDPNNLGWALLGYNVKAYYKENEDGDNELLYVLKYRNNELTIAAEDILPETNEKTIRYLKGDLEKKIDLLPTVRVLHNYTLAVPFTEAMLKPSSGEIVFVDNNRDGEYEVLLVNEYQDYYVSGIDSANGIVYDKYSKAAVTTEEKYVTVERNGKKTDVSAITAGDIVSVYQSANYVRMVISSQSAEGTISAFSSDADDRKVKVNGETYTTSPDYEAALKSGKASTPKIGDSGKLLLNFKGEIVAFTETSGVKKYGFMTHIYTNDEEEELYVRIYDSSAVKQDYKMRENASVSLGATVYKLKTVGVPDMKALITPDKLVRYELNGGEVSKLYISDGSVNADYTLDTKNELLLNHSPAKGYYGNTSCMADNEWHCTTGTVIFDIPTKADGSVIDEDIKVIAPDKVINGSYQMEIYDANKSKIPSAVVIYNANSVSNSGIYYDYKSYVVVSDCYDGLNENDEQVSVLEGWYKGTLTTYKTDNAALFSGFDTGDVVQIALLDGEPAAARLLYKNAAVTDAEYTDKTQTYINTLHKRDVAQYGFSTPDSIYTNKSSDYMLVHANVLDVNANYITVQYAADPLDTAMTTNKGYTVLTYPIKSWTKIYKITGNDKNNVASATTGEIRSASGFGVMNGSRVLLNVRAQRVDEIFIFED